MTPEQAAYFNAGLEAANRAVKGVPRRTGANISTWDEARYRGVEHALVALSALSVPADLIAVPREPTDEMAAAAIAALGAQAAWTWPDQCKAIYRAMISAWENRG